MLVNNTIINQFLESNNINASFLKLLEQFLIEAEYENITIHPYGFYIIKIKHTEDTQIRLHIWLENLRKRQKPDWPPHTHNFDLNSIILKGSLIHNLWKTTPTVKNQRVLYQVDYKSNISTLNKTTHVVNCNLISSKPYSAGESYKLDKYEFHSVEVDKNSKAMTLCVMTNPSEKPQYVVGDITAKEIYKFERQNISKEEIFAVLYEVKLLLKDRSE